ncbi:hypothetical protein KUCAC02_026307 [Chaenocephalus aceratus]|uniref:Uncharacterized protein n=1 Tax=Chaenocephalus aceratus TaxID=36190 RepID=A0ACB9VX37_CHAAC|nr:hypothetical protein KUCAC02_026307 [Chaenocephalus aceratus]
MWSAQRRYQGVAKKEGMSAVPPAGQRSRNMPDRQLSTSSRNRPDKCWPVHQRKYLRPGIPNAGTGLVSAEDLVEEYNGRSQDGG